MGVTFSTSRTSGPLRGNAIDARLCGSGVFFSKGAQLMLKELDRVVLTAPHGSWLLAKNGQQAQGWLRCLTGRRSSAP